MLDVLVIVGPVYHVVLVKEVELGVVIGTVDSLGSYILQLGVKSMSSKAIVAF